MFGKRIVQLRNQQKLTQTELARAIGISRSALSLYEIEKREPDIETLNKLASLFHVPVDYLLGREQEVVDYVNSPTSIFCSKIAARIRNIATTSNKNLDEILPLLKTEILDGKCYNIDAFMQDIYTISDFFGISDDYILGSKELETQVYSDRERDVIENFRLLNKDNQDIIVGELKKCLKEQRYEESVAADEPLKRTGTDSLGK